MGQEEHNKKAGKWKQISEKERYKIEALSRSGVRPTEIGNQLGRDRRTIEREIERGSVIQRRENPYASRNPQVADYLDEMCYCADAGQRVKEERGGNKGRGLKIGSAHNLARHIEKKIKAEKYAPAAVIGEIKERGLLFEVMICTKTLYNYIDSGLFLNISNQDLPVKKNGRKRRYRPMRSVALNNTKGRSIDERPETIESRSESGHWEMDCVVGKGKACLLVLTERKSREELLFKLKSKTQSQVIGIIDRLERRHKGTFSTRFKSITMDNSCEFLDFERLEASSLSKSDRRTTVYYAHPYSAWERGSNENANKLIRRFIPKGTDIGKLNAKDIKRIEYWMNNYPRRMFGYKSANQMKSA